CAPGEEPAVQNPRAPIQHSKKPSGGGPEGGLTIKPAQKPGKSFPPAVPQTSDVGQVESQGSPESGTKASTPASVFSPFENDIDSPRTARVETSVGDAVISQGRRSTGSRRKLLSTRAVLAIRSAFVVCT